jgi:hypothetical protein
MTSKAVKVPVFAYVAFVRSIVMHSVYVNRQRFHPSKTFFANAALEFCSFVAISLGLLVIFVAFGQQMVLKSASGQESAVARFTPSCFIS